MNTEQLVSLRECRDESELTFFMTPYLSELFKDRVIVNSETFPWLHTGSGAKQKPDLFTCPKWVYKARNLDTPSSIQRYGGVSDRRLYSMTPFTCWTAKRSSLLLLLASSLFTCSISTRPKTLKYLGECSLGKPSSGLPLYRARSFAIE